MSIQVSARATVTVEFLVASNWGDDCSMAQIEKQAREEAIQILGRRATVGDIRLNIIDAPRIQVVLIERPR